ncbi:MAG: hypothetical protein HW397_500 [Dehalococcoidia bacterium]|nr:hypothetical protein [Dehalococcoidia bacterium]
MEYKFFSEYVGQPTIGVPFTTREEELLWMVDSEADGLALAGKVLSKEFQKHGVRLVSVQLKLEAEEHQGWATIKAFPLYRDHGGDGVVLRS